MGNAARKARKRNGIKFVHNEKTPTPLEERGIRLVVDQNGKENGEVVQHFSKRYARKIEKQMSFRTQTSEA